MSRAELGRERLLTAIAILALAAAVGATDAPPAVSIQHDIVYARAAARSAPGGEIGLKLDLYEPDGRPSHPRPAVIVLHGGGLTRGHKASPEGLAEFCEALVAHGYVCASIDYRLERDDPPMDGETLHERTLAAATADAAEAIRWLRSQSAAHSIDRNRIALAGHSAGASVVMALAYSRPGRRLRISAVISMSGALHRLSMRHGDAPLCIVQGKNDTLVPMSEADALAESARRAGARYEMLVVEGTGHGTMTSLDRLVAGAPLLDRILAFLRR